MANDITAVSVENDLVIPGGIMKFDNWDSDNNTTGLLDLGESEELTITVTQETLVRNTRRTATRAEIARNVVSTTREGTLTTLSVNDENVRLILAGNKSTVTQSATPVTNEEIKNVQNDREYYLGVTTANPVGVIGATSVAIRNYDATAAIWVTATAYAVGDNVTKVTDDGTVFRCKTAGTTGGSEPTWVEASVATTGTEGDLTTDGTVVWEYIASANTTYTVVTDYELDDTETTGARFKWITSVAQPRYAYVDYTPVANTRSRVATAMDVVDLTGTLVIETANDGNDSRYVLPKVRLTSAGDWALINDGGSFQSLTLAMSILEDGSKEAIYRDGMPV